MVALLIYVGSNMMRDLAGRTAQADALVVGSGADPNGPAVVVRLIGLPKPDVIALSRVVADRLLESQIFLTTEEKQITYRRVNVRTGQHRVFRDFEVALNP